MVRPENGAGQVGKAMRRIGLISAAASAAMAWCLGAAPAQACSILPPPPSPPVAAGTSAADAEALSRAWSEAQSARYGAEQRDWSLGQQARLFDEAKGLVLVRFDRQDPARDTNDSPVAVLKALRWVKGSGPLGEVRLGMSVPPPCGQIKGHDAYYGKAGEVFLVYVSGSDLKPASVIEAYAIGRIIEPRTIAALTTR